MTTYAEFIRAKSDLDYESGFDPVFMPDFLFDFQRAIIEWAVRKGRSSIFADCGMGKTPMQLVWAENVARKTGGRVLIVTPIAVGHQTVREGEKFGIECARSIDGEPAAQITVTNYERIHLFDPSDFEGVVCDESSALKSYDGKRRGLVTSFVKHRPYRLLCTATAAPNDYIELGTSSEALGVLGYQDMLSKFFKNEQGSGNPNRLWAGAKWRFKRHAEDSFWRWVCSWARALRKPSDMGFDDGKFILPELIERETIVQTSKRMPGELFARPAISLKDQRAERRMTLDERCEMAAAMSAGVDPCVVWCHLNDEGDRLEELIPDAEQVSGADSDEAKEEKLLAFGEGKIRVLVTKPQIGAFGLNWQHCSRMTFFPSHSFEQYYQGVRRCWRFGQDRPVTVDIITTEGELGVLKNLQRKAAAADTMFASLVLHMNDSMKMQRPNLHTKSEEIPAWLSQNN